MTNMARGEKLLGKDVQDIEGLSLVSVIVPTKDRPQFLSSAIKSILNQTYKNIEIIVINDGGEDISHIIALYNGSVRIVHLRLEKSMGPSASRNAGLQHASGKYIAYLDDDDIYYPGHLETLVAALEGGNCSVAYADSYQAFQRMEGGRYVTYDKQLIYSEDFNRERLLVMNYIRTENIIHRTDCVAEVGMFDEELRTHEDWDFWIRLSRAYDFRHIKTVTAEFRTRTKSEGITASNRPDFLRTMKLIHARYGHLSSNPEVVRQQKFIQGELEKEIVAGSITCAAAAGLSLVRSRKGVWSLRVALDDGTVKSLHSAYDPEAEAKSIVEAFRFNGKGVLIVLGLGLGYHLAELLRKFPEAEIAVVEALPEIYELSKGHGPEISGNVQYLTGLSPDEALREISKIQMRNGIKPLSMFTLSSGVSAFPAYYRPILDALNKTMSVKLWDRLRYSKFKQYKQKVLLIDTGYFLVREAEQALRSLGHEVLRVPVKYDPRESPLGKGGIKAGHDGDRIISGLIEAIVDFKPDFLLTMNHLGFDEAGALTGFFRSIEMPVASWYVDSPKLIVEAFDKNVSPWTSLFLWDKSYMKDMEAMGFEAVEYLPLGTDERVFKPMTAGKHRKKMAVYSCDTGFVGNSMVGPVKEWMEKVDQDLHPVVEKAAELVAGPAVLRGDIMKVIPETERGKIAGLPKKEKMDFEAAVLWKATLLYRSACIKKLEGFDVHVHGDSAWRELLKDRSFKLCPPLNYYKELPFLYNTCRINFNATSRQMSEAVNQRVFDVPACGSFILTDYQDSLKGLFEVGKEIIVYKNKDEIPDLVKYYLDNPGEREAVAGRGRERVLKEHTYKHRLELIINKMKERYL